MTPRRAPRTSLALIVPEQRDHDHNHDHERSAINERLLLKHTTLVSLKGRWSHTWWQQFEVLCNSWRLGEEADLTLDRQFLKPTHSRHILSKEVGSSVCSQYTDLPASLGELNDVPLQPRLSVSTQKIPEIGSHVGEGAIQF